MTRGDYVLGCAELLRMPLQAIPPPADDNAHDLRLRTVLRQLGVETRGHCRRCESTLLFAELSPDGLCLACALIVREEHGSVIYWDPTVERLAHDTEPLLSSARDTRPTDPCEPPDDWAGEE